MLKKAKVLIIEDESDIATIIRDYLSVNHFEPYIAQNGHEAIQRLGQNSIILKNSENRQ